MGNWASALEVGYCRLSNVQHPVERDSPALELCPGLGDTCEFTLLLLRGRGDCHGEGESLVAAISRH